MEGSSVEAPLEVDALYDDRAGQSPVPPTVLLRPQIDEERTSRHLLGEPLRRDAPQVRPALRQQAIDGAGVSHDGRSDGGHEPPGAGR